MFLENFERKDLTLFQQIKAIGQLLKTNTSSKTVRRDLVKENFEIILLIGDNLGDFSEIFEDRSNNFGFDIVEENKAKFGEKFIVLPNPMYGSWENEVLDFKRDLSNEGKYNLRKSHLINVSSK